SHTQYHARAAYWLERAGDQAARGFANAAAVAHYAAARERVRASGADAASQSRLEERLGELRVVLGEFTQAREEFARARDGIHEPARRAELWRKEAVVWFRQGESAQALAALAAADSEGRDGDSSASLPGRVQAAVDLNRSEVLRTLGDWDAADAAI